MTNPPKTNKEIVAEILAEPYDPNWRVTVAKQIMDWVAEQDAAGVTVPNRWLHEELNRIGPGSVTVMKGEVK